jgi:hypothetical protein
LDTAERSAARVIAPCVWLELEGIHEVAIRRINLLAVLETAGMAAAPSRQMV